VASWTYPSLRGDLNCNRILCSGFISTVHPVAAPCKRYYRLLAEDARLLGNDVMLLGVQYPMFRRIVVPSSSECSSRNHHSVPYQKSREQYTYNQDVYVTQGLLQINTKMLIALLKLFSTHFRENNNLYEVLILIAQSE